MNKHELEQLAESGRPKTASELMTETVAQGGGTFTVISPHDMSQWRVMVVPVSEAPVLQVFVSNEALKALSVDDAKMLDSIGAVVPKWAVNQAFDLYNLTADAARMMMKAKPNKAYNLSRAGYEELVKLGILKVTKPA